MSLQLRESVAQATDPLSPRAPALLWNEHLILVLLQPI